MSASLTALFASADRGDPRATGALFASLYSELHRLAERQLAHTVPGASLGATSLLHEAYLDMSGREGTSFPDEARFLGYAARVMRGVIIDAVRRGQAVKRGGGFELTGFDGREVAVDDESTELQALGDALDSLSRVDPALAELVDLKYFCGFNFAQIAALRGIGERTVQRQWEKARLYLHQALREGPGAGKP